MERQACLGDVADFVNGAAVKPEDWGDDGHPIIRIQNLTDRSKPFNRTRRSVSEKLYVKPGDLLVSWSATLGVFEWDRAETGVLNQHIFRVIPDPSRIDKAYLRHAVVVALLAMQRHLHGATMQHVNRGEFLATPLHLPPLPEQRRIAAILDQADVLKAKRREALAQLDSLTQSIFVEMFGDPASNPLGWPDSGLGNAVQLMQYGPRFYDEAYSVDGVRIARITDLSEEGDLDFDSMPRMAVTPKDLTQFALQPGDLIFARTGATVGKVALYREGNPACIPGAYFIRMKFRSDIIPDYVATLLKTSSVREMVTLQSRQAAQQNFSGPGLRRLPLPVPPLALQQTFATRLQAVSALKAIHRAALTELDALFVSLQHRAFAGQLS